MNKTLLPADWHCIDEMHLSNGKGVFVYDRDEAFDADKVPVAAYMHERSADDLGLGRISSELMRLESAAEQHGQRVKYAIVAIGMDKTAPLSARNDLSRLVSVLNDHEIATVYIHDASKLSRNPTTVGDFLTLASENGVSVASANSRGVAEVEARAVVESVETTIQKNRRGGSNRFMAGRGRGPRTTFGLA
jgi:hypothetical protein